MRKDFFPQKPMSDGSLECRLQCCEWSDGQVGCLCRRYTFHELQEAYRNMKNSAQPDDERIITQLLEIVHAYNDEFSRGTHPEKEPQPGDYGFFVKAVLELQEKGRDVLPASLRAELYREAGMFENCFGFSSHACRSRDEKEIMDEVLFRAAHADRRPFIIEQCEFYRDKARPVKRFPCPQFKR